MTEEIEKGNRSDLLEDEDSGGSAAAGFDLALDRSGYLSFDPDETAA